MIFVSFDAGLTSTYLLVRSTETKQESIHLSSTS